MSFASALSIANSGLAVASARAQNVANNVANAGTEGYTRRIVSVAEVSVGGAPGGVQILGMENVRAPYLTATRMRLEAENAFASERADAASRITDMIGEPGTDSGLFGAYARFESALRDVAASPETTILQKGAVDAAANIVRTFDMLSASANQMRTEADRAIARSVATVNEALVQLEKLNELASSDLTPEVIDERQRLVDRINAEIPVTVQQAGDTIYLVTDGGQLLLTERARQLEFLPAGAVGRTQSLGSPLSGLSVNGVDITPSGNSAQRTQGGRLAALFDTRDVRVPAFQEQLDALAFDLVARFSDDAVDPSKTPGAAGLFTDGTATPPAAITAGIAERLSLNPAINPQAGGSVWRLRDGIGAAAPGAAGNGDQLNRMINAFTAQNPAPGVLSLTGNRSSAELVAAVNASVGFDEKALADAALFAGTRYDIARESELSAVGVDTDQELQQLLLIEQAYAANARVIQTIDELMNQLLRIA